MALINVAIYFGYEYLFCQNFFSTFFFQHFFLLFSKIFSRNFFFKFFFSKLFFPIFSSEFFFQHFFLTFFLIFFYDGFTLDASPFTETKRTLCICVMKNMIYSKRSKLDFSHVWSSFLLRFILLRSHSTWKVQLFLPRNA